MRVRRVRPWRVFNVLLLVVGLIALFVYWITGGFDSRPLAFIRVNQLGYALEEPKYAFLLMRKPLDTQHFEVISEDGANKGKQVLTGTVGQDRGAWKHELQSIYALDFSDLTEPGRYRIRLEDDIDERSPQFTVDTASALYASQLDASAAGFFRAQRDTEHPSDQHATVFHNPEFERSSAVGPLTPTGVQVDVEGGWYHDGSYTKFTHASAYTVICMALALRDAGGASAHPELAAELEYGLTWLRKMWDSDQRVLYAQVGLMTGASDGSIEGERDVWRTAADDETGDRDVGDKDYYLKHRPVFGANEPGEPVPPNIAGRYAAAFALAAQVSPVDHARQYLALAADVFSAAQTDESVGLVTTFPPGDGAESNWTDDMELAAAVMAATAQQLSDSRAEVWQTEATHWARAYMDSHEYADLSSTDVGALAHAQLVALLQSTDHALVSELASHMGRAVRSAEEFAAGQPAGNGRPLSEPHALTQIIGSVINAHYLGSLLPDFHTEDQRDRNRRFAAQQLGFALGANPWGLSFVVDVGDTTPQCPHHRGANLEQTSLHGAVVPGPAEKRSPTTLVDIDGARECHTSYQRFDSSDAQYLDDVRAADMNEPTLATSATALLAFAR